MEVCFPFSIIIIILDAWKIDTYPDSDDNRVIQVGSLDLGNFKISGQLEILKRLF